MRLKDDLRSVLQNSGFNTESLILTLLQIYHNINLTLNLDHLLYLDKAGLVCRDKSGKLALTIGLYQDEEEPQIVSRTDMLTDVMEKYQEYRNLFKGIRTGAMGDKQQVIDNLIRFCRDENQPMDHIIKVTQDYLDRTDYPFNADNFIYSYKNSKEVSPLRTAIEEQGETNYSNTKLI
jgi:hypothetical protein